MININKQTLKLTIITSGNNGKTKLKCKCNETK